MKIFFVDIDGTIVDTENGNHHPSIKTQYAFKKLQENGDKVFICSGRAKCLLTQDIIDLKPDGFILANGGYCEYEDQKLFSERMDDTVVHNLIEYCNTHNLCYYMESYDKIYTEDLKNPTHVNFCGEWGTDCYTDERLPEAVDINIAMIALSEENKEVRAALEAYCAEDFDLLAHNFFCSYDVNIKDISKGTAISRVLDHFKIDRDAAYAFGDGNNDLEMLMSVKHSVAMENAVQKLKDIAETITTSVAQDGFYEYLVNKSLIEPIV